MSLSLLIGSDSYSDQHEEERRVKSNFKSLQGACAYMPTEHPHPLGEDYSYGYYRNSLGGKVECCLVKNFTKENFDALLQFNKRMRSANFGDFLLPVYGYNEENKILVVEKFDDNLHSSVKQMMESGKYVQVWKDEADPLSGQSLLRPMFAFLLVHCPEEYHPNLLGSIFITSTSQVKFLSKLKVKKDEIFKSRVDRIYRNRVNTHREFETNLHEVLSFISSLCLGIKPQDILLLGKMPCDQDSLVDTCSHLPLNLKLLYKYLFFFDPKKHSTHLFFDPPFLHSSSEKENHVNRVIREITYNPMLRSSQNKLDFLDWRTKLTTSTGPIGLFESHGLWALYSQKDCITFHSNFIKHCNEQLEKTQKSKLNDTPPEELEKLAEETLATSYFTYQLINDFIYDNPGMGYEQEFLITKNWAPLGYLQHLDSNDFGETNLLPS